MHEENAVGLVERNIVNAKGKLKPNINCSLNPVFYNLFVAAEPSANVYVAHGTPGLLAGPSKCQAQCKTYRYGAPLIL